MLDPVAEEEFRKAGLRFVPQGWKVKRLKQVASYVDYRGKTPPKTSHGRFLITAKNIRSGYIDYQASSEYIPRECYAEVMSRGLPKFGDVLITTEAPLGNVAVIDREDVALAQRVIKYRADQKILCPGYLKHYLMGGVFQHSLTLEATGGTVKGIKGSRLHQMRIAFPPLPEQKAIAEVLECWDRGIGDLELIIEKKKKVKKGLMQQLLTGKMRLPGFGPVLREEDQGVPEGWELRELKHVGRIESGGTPSTENSDFCDGDIPWCTPSEVAQLTERCISMTSRMITEEGLENSSAKLLPANSLIVCTRATVGDCGLNSVPMATNQGFKSIIVNKAHCVEFLYYVMCTLKTHLIRFSSGSTFLEISKHDFSKTKVILPNLHEQRAVAKILIDADSEISMLEIKLAAIKDQKKHLLNNLVTGAVRLPQFVSDEVTA